MQLYCLTFLLSSFVDRANGDLIVLNKLSITFRNGVVTIVVNIDKINKAYIKSCSTINILNIYLYTNYLYSELWGQVFAVKGKCVLVLNPLALID